MVALKITKGTQLRNSAIISLNLRQQASDRLSYRRNISLDEKRIAT